MARYSYKTIKTADIPEVQPYQFRRMTLDPSLLASVKKRGIQQPLVVTQARELLSGHRRFAAARELKISEIEILELKTAVTPQEGFLCALLSNWNQPYSDLEKAGILMLASKSFGFSRHEIFEEVFPAMGLSADDSGIFQEAQEVMSLEASLIDLIARDLLPYRGARILTRFTSSDQKAFAGFSLKAALTANQLLKAGEWLYDLGKSSGLTLEKIFSKNDFDAVLNHPGLDRRAKGEKCYQKIRQIRFPSLCAKETQFSALSGKFTGGQPGILIEAPSFFEGEGLILKAKLTSAQSVETVLETIRSKRKVLNSLLDIVL